VAFSPTTTGVLNGTLTITDNSNGVSSSTQSVALSGTGQDFTLTAATGSPTSVTVAPGQTATYTLSLAPGQGGFNQSVSFTCTSPARFTNCSFSPNVVTPGSSAMNVTLMVTTTAPSAGQPRPRPLPPLPPLSAGLRVLLLASLTLAWMVWAITRRNQPGVGRWQSKMVPLAARLLLVLALVGCGGGGGGGNPPPSNTGTPPGTYSFTVTGTSGSASSALSHSVPLTLTVS
jgi:hypothetical protein